MPTRVGVKVWPWPASSPAKPVTSSVAEVVISAALAAPERVEVQQDHQDTQEADGEEAEVLVEQSTHRAQHRRERERAHARDLLAPLALDADEEPDGERQREPGERRHVGPRRELGAHPRTIRACRRSS